MVRIVDSPADLSAATWNIQAIRGASAAKTRRIVDALDRHRPDVVALQEVRSDETADRVIGPLAGIGLDHAYFSGILADPEMPRPKSYGNVIASRWHIEPITWPVTATWPQLTAAATIDQPDGRVLVVCAHIPNGSGNGWEKVYALEALDAGLSSLELPTVLAGDFNEPRTFTPVFASFRADELCQTEGDYRDLFASPTPDSDGRTPWPPSSGNTWRTTREDGVVASQLSKPESTRSPRTWSMADTPATSTTS